MVLFAVVSLLLLSSDAAGGRPANSAGRSAKAEPLAFGEFFEAGPGELKPTAKLLQLHGKRVKLVGYMAQLEEPPDGAFYLAAQPIVGHRNAGTGVCDQYLDESDWEGSGGYGTGLAVLMGGGRRWFLPAGQFGSSRSASTDYDQLPEDLVEAWHLPSRGKLDPQRDLIQDFIDRGFAKQSHLMDADRVVDETIEFDYAVGVAKRFADDAGDTLIVVLADHECSGFSLIGALTGGIANLRKLPPENELLDPAIQPERQRVVGTYDAAGFPRYNILKDGYPETFDIDGKILVGYGASGDRYEGWLMKPLPIVDSLLPEDIKAELAARADSPQPWQF